MLAIANKTLLNTGAYKKSNHQGKLSALAGDKDWEQTKENVDKKSILQVNFLQVLLSNSLGCLWYS